MFGINPKTKIVTHSGGFHADDVFAVATLILATAGPDGTVHDVEIIRSRNPEIVNSGDFVVDVGSVYDEAKNRFDHHQPGGAGERQNKIPYAAFGLVWKKFGESVCGSKNVAQMIDQKLVQPIDATDNGFSIMTEIVKEVRPYDMSAIIGGMNPDWNEEENQENKIFLSAVEFAQKILRREIQSAVNEVEGEKLALDIYNQTADKRLIVFDKKYPFERAFSKLPEPLFVIYPNEGKWWFKAVRTNLNTFVNRKDLPKAWAGKRGAELSAVSGVPGGVFCHNMLFSAGNDTKDGAIAMAKIAIDA